MATTEFTFNNKIHIATKSSPFKVNYEREPRIGFDIRKKGKYVKVEEFVKEMKDKHEEAKAVLIKSQEEMKRYTDRNRKKVKEYKVRDKVLISTKNFLIELMKRATKKLTIRLVNIGLEFLLIFFFIFNLIFDLFLKSRVRVRATSQLHTVIQSYGCIEHSCQTCEAWILVFLFYFIFSFIFFILDLGLGLE